MMVSCIKDIGQVRFDSPRPRACSTGQGGQRSVTGCRDVNQDVVQVRLDEGCQGMSRLIHNRLFLTSMVHALEEQKSFSIKDR